MCGIIAIFGEGVPIDSIIGDAERLLGHEGVLGRLLG